MDIVLTWLYRGVVSFKSENICNLCRIIWD